jgi:hypothetical protein
MLTYFRLHNYDEMKSHEYEMVETTSDEGKNFLQMRILFGQKTEWSGPKPVSIQSLINYLLDDEDGFLLHHLVAVYVTGYIIR